jgi:hypothetical protein
MIYKSFQVNFVNGLDLSNIIAAQQASTIAIKMSSSFRFKSRIGQCGADHSATPHRFLGQTIEFETNSASFLSQPHST